MINRILYLQRTWSIGALESNARLSVRDCASVRLLPKTLYILLSRVLGFVDTSGAFTARVLSSEIGFLDSRESADQLRDQK